MLRGHRRALAVIRSRLHFLRFGKPRELHAVDDVRVAMRAATEGGPKQLGEVTRGM